MLALSGGYGGSIYELVTIYFAVSVVACIAYGFTRWLWLSAPLGIVLVYAVIGVLSVSDPFFNGLWRDIVFLYPRFIWNWELFLLFWFIPLFLASATIIVIRQ